ncbi:hypothetical protein L218DRAFT_948273 [Marasmius fiardii PR-910]|nr:hypothetical protein L218DRAFT_948273 [Marasmius fiardii PR-910]
MIDTPCFGHFESYSFCTAQLAAIDPNLTPWGESPVVQSAPAPEEDLNRTQGTKKSKQDFMSDHAQKTLSDRNKLREPIFPTVSALDSSARNSPCSTASTTKEDSNLGGDILSLSLSPPKKLALEPQLSNSVTDITDGNECPSFVQLLGFSFHEYVHRSVSVVQGLPSSLMTPLGITVAFFLVIVDTHHDLILCSVGMFAVTIFHNLDRLLIYTYLVEKYFDKNRRRRHVFSEVRRNPNERIKSSFEESSKEKSCTTTLFVMATAGPGELDLEQIAIVSVCGNAIILHWVSSGASSDSIKDFTLPQITLTVGDHWAVESMDNDADRVIVRGSTEKTVTSVPGTTT